MKRTEFKAVCPFCKTHLLDIQQGLGYPTFGQAVARIKSHWSYACQSVPKMNKREREAVAENNVEVLELP